MKWSLFETSPLIYFIKLYANLIQTETMLVVVSLHKICLGQSWQEKSIFQELVGDNIHILTGWESGLFVNCDFKH
jgi:hypothetical protein